MFDSWNGKCHRCGKETRCHTMSMFNEDLICMDCKSAERREPKFEEARTAENDAIRSGNYNFKGIGR